MGKGDIKTRRGKITNKSFGNVRPHKAKKSQKTTVRSSSVKVKAKTARKSTAKSKASAPKTSSV